MVSQPFLGKGLVFGAGASVVGKGMDADASTRDEETENLNVAGIHQLDQVIHDNVDAILMEIAMVAEREEVKLETLALHHTAVGDIHDFNLSKVGLSSDGAKRGKLGAIELHPIVAVGMLVLEGLKHLGCIGFRYLAFASQRLKVILFAVTHVLSDFKYLVYLQGQSPCRIFLDIVDRSLHDFGVAGVIPHIARLQETMRNGDMAVLRRFVPAVE